MSEPGGSSGAQNAGGRSTHASRKDAQSYVFMSYAREDEAQAKAISEALGAESLQVWWDPELLGGTDVSTAISTALARASCVVVLWSKASVTSHWVKDEAQEGRDRDVLVPVRLEDVELPLGFRQIHTLQLSGWSGSRDDRTFKKLVRSIRAAFERARVARAGSRPEALAIVKPDVNAPRQPVASAVSHRQDWAVSAILLAPAIVGMAYLIVQAIRHDPSEARPTVIGAGTGEDLVKQPEDRSASGTYTVINGVPDALTAADVARVLRAINTQVTRDFAQHWDRVGVLKPGSAPQSGDRGIVRIVDHDEFATPAYHQVEHGLIEIRLALRELREANLPWSVALSHEFLETLAAPQSSMTALGPNPEAPDTQVAFSYEVCNPVMAETYEIDGVSVSNFVYPSYFELGSDDTQVDFLGKRYEGKRLKPFSVNPGGWLMFFDSQGNPHSWSPRAPNAAHGANAGSTP